MQKITAIILVILGGWSASLAQERISLEQCLQAAERNRQTELQTELIGIVEDAELSATMHYYLPQLELQGRASWQNEVPEIPLLSSASAGTGALNPMLPGLKIPTVPKDQYSIALQAGQVLWDGGKIAAGKAKVRAETAVAKAQIDVENRKLKERVRDLYFGCLLVDGQLELQKTLIDELHRQSNRIQTYIDNGLASLNDKDEVRVELLKAEQKAEELRLDKASLAKLLSIYTGLDLNAKTQLERPHSAPSSTGNESLVGRPELHLISAQEQLIQADWKRERSEMIPTFSLFAQAGYARPALNLFDPDFRPFFIGGIKLSWNIGRLYSLGNKDRSREAQMRQVAVRYQLAQQDLAAEAESKRAQLAKLKASLTQDQEMIKIRQTIKKRAEVQVANGTLSTAELMERISALQIAQQTQLLHELQALKQTYELRSSLGIE